MGKDEHGGCQHFLLLTMFQKSLFLWVVSTRCAKLETKVAPMSRLKVVLNTLPAVSTSVIGVADFESF